MEMNHREFIAHARQEESGEWAEPHLLEDHLRDVAKLATDYSNAFKSSGWGYLAGIWHDLGKFQPAFQDYIRHKSGFERENAHIEQGRVTHSTAGAVYAIDKQGPMYGHVLAYLIAGHHAGLADWDGGPSSLKYRLKEGRAEYQASLAQHIASEILESKTLEMHSCAKNKESIALWIRMLFSCLVDADFLDTELYMDSKKSSNRTSGLALIKLESVFQRKLSDLKGNVRKLATSESNMKLQNIRSEIHESCVKAAALNPGVFSLTVPTGGGKTLSSMAFALEHAKKFNKKRIIYAIPFTSIIEQNAKVFREFLGNDSVLEHHSNLDVELAKENSHSRLAAENWDFPLVVTTNVQLFESLFAAKTSRCRKLHNLVDSVIILDEAQQLPRDFHAPITQVMQQLSDYFGVTWLLCTATQPELGQQKDAFDKELLSGLRDVREIIENPVELAENLKRVSVEWPDTGSPPSSWEHIATAMRNEDCVLTIVNTRKNANNLFSLLPNDGNNLHLSANMCAEHRTIVIDDIKRRLKQRLGGDRRPLRVVSTQLIEAGVDVDFPVVYRAMAGLDSIAQSAGRCNREGRLEGLGRVIVFMPQQGAPAGFLRQGEQTTLAMVKGGLLDDSLSPQAFKEYFKQLNSLGDRDKHGICKLLTAESTRDDPLSISFRTAAEKFKLIDDAGVSVIVPFNPDPEFHEDSPVEQWLSMLEKDASQKWIYRKLQRYTVGLSENVVKKMGEKGMIRSKAGQWLVESSSYHVVWGVTMPETLFSAQDLVI